MNKSAYCVQQEVCPACGKVKPSLRITLYGICQDCWEYAVKNNQAVHNLVFQMEQVEDAIEKFTQYQNQSREEYMKKANGTLDDLINSVKQLLDGWTLPSSEGK